MHTASNHEEAAAWDLEQQVGMTPDERRAAARTLKVRAYGAAAPDVRASTERA